MFSIAMLSHVHSLSLDWIAYLSSGEIHLVLGCPFFNCPFSVALSILVDRSVTCLLEGLVDLNFDLKRFFFTHRLCVKARDRVDVEGGGKR